MAEEFSTNPQPDLIPVARPEEEELPLVDSIVEAAGQLGMKETPDMVGAKAEALGVPEDDVDGFGERLGQYQILGEQQITPLAKNKLLGTKLQHALAVLCADIYRQRPEKDIKDYAVETLRMEIEFFTDKAEELGINPKILESLNKILLTLTQPPVQE